MRFYASLLSFALLVLAGCARQGSLDYGFVISNVLVSPAYQALDIRLQQDLQLSQQAQEALEHGVTLSIRLEMELRNDSNMIVTRRDVRYFHLRYLPLIERFQLSEEETGNLQSFSRLRHLLAVIDNLNVQLSTGPLPTGSYELRTRIRLDESRLPTPMQLPAWFSRQWQHDSEWSVWPFEINA
jgi:hypothetical protein